MRVFTSLSLIISSFALLVPGCMTPQDGDGDDAATATLEIPLEQGGPDGALYHLSADFQIDGPSISTVFRSTLGEPAISLRLAPGLVNVALLDGWTLSRSDDHGGTFQPVSAVLGSLRLQQVRLLANHSDSIVFEFLVRSTNGDLSITFGVATRPRELAGALVVDQGTDAFAVYPHNQQIDFATYYQLLALDNDVLADGSKDRVFVSDTSASEYFNDPFGALATLAPTMNGAVLVWHLIARPDGSQEISGELDGQVAPFSVLKFGPHTLVFPLPLDGDGFVSDQFLFETVPFTLDVFGDAGGHLNGRLRLRSIPVSN